MLYDKIRCRIKKAILQNGGKELLMYTVILIDEDISTLNSIKNSIPFNKLGIEIIETATNGTEGMNIIKKLKPDIVICDTQLPELDGFEMISRLRNINITPKTILLTQSLNFEHTRAAIDTNIISYITKPLVYEDLVQALKKAISLLEEKKQNELNKLYKQEHELYLQKQFIDTLFHSDNISNKQEEVFNKTIIKNAENLLYLCVVIYTKNLSTRSNLLDDIQNETKLLGDWYQANPTNNTISLLFCSNIEEENVLEALTQKLHKILKKYNPCFAGISNAVDSIKQINECYKQATQVQKHRYCYINKVYAENYASFSQDLGYFLDNQPKINFIELANSITQKNPKTTLEIFAEFKDRCTKFKVYDMDIIKSNLFVACSTLIEQIKVDFLNTKSFSQNEIWQNIDSISSLNPLFEYAKDVVDCYCKYLAHSATSYNKKIVMQMMEYTKLHYMEPISLVFFSKQLFHSRNYLRMIFQKETGISYKEFLNDIRMEKALDLLSSGYKLYEIAEQVGYKDLKTFRTYFSLKYGCLPSDYISNQ